MKRIITLTTDFGSRDGFVGTMKGVILGINPEANIVDITHEIAPQNIEEGAFVFAASVKYFPANAIHVVVVDPGVGSARRPIAVQTGETIYVAPDNGILPWVIFGAAGFVPLSGHPPRLLRGTPSVFPRPAPYLRSPVDRIVHLNNPAFWLPRVSRTFHGRDIFAPCAAHLSLGVPLHALGEPIADWKWFVPAAFAHRVQDSVFGRVVHVDRFGNAITNVQAEMLRGMEPARIRVSIRGRELRGLSETYADVASGEPLALIGSSGHLEIAVRDGNAVQTLSIRVGQGVVVSLEPQRSG